MSKTSRRKLKKLFLSALHDQNDLANLIRVMTRMGLRAIVYGEHTILIDRLKRGVMHKVTPEGGYTGEGILNLVDEEEEKPMASAVVEQVEPLELFQAIRIAIVKKYGTQVGTPKIIPLYAVGELTRYRVNYRTALDGYVFRSYRVLANATTTEVVEIVA